MEREKTMLNFLSCEGEPDFSHEEETMQFLHNILAFTYAMDMNDTRYLCQEVQEGIKTIPNFLEGMLRYMMPPLADGLEESGMFESRDQIVEQLCTLQDLHNSFTVKEPPEEIKNIFLLMRDRFLIGLMVSKGFQKWLREQLAFEEQQRKGALKS